MQEKKYQNKTYVIPSPLLGLQYEAQGFPGVPFRRHQGGGKPENRDLCCNHFVLCVNNNR